MLDLDHEHRGPFSGVLLIGRELDSRACGYVRRIQGWAMKSTPRSVQPSSCFAVEVWNLANVVGHRRS